MLGYFKGEDFNGGNVAPVQGQAKNLDASSVHIKSDPNAITPDNPGSWKSYREVPQLNEARAFDEDEAGVIREKRKDTRRKRKASKRVYKDLQEIDNDETAINRYYETYRRNSGRNEKRKQTYKNTSAKYLHSLRPEYASLGQGLEKSAQAADQAIAALQNQL